MGNWVNLKLWTSEETKVVESWGQLKYIELSVYIKHYGESAGGQIGIKSTQPLLKFVEERLI